MRWILEISLYRLNSFENGLHIDGCAVPTCLHGSVNMGCVYTTEFTQGAYSLSLLRVQVCNPQMYTDHHYYSMRSDMGHKVGEVGCVVETYSFWNVYSLKFVYS